MRWPASLLRGALLVANEQVLRCESNERQRATPDLPLLLECAAVRATLDSLLPCVVGSSRHSTAAGEPPFDERRPLGSVLIVSAPDCPSDVIVRHALAALIAGNRVALSHHRSVGLVARIVLDSLQRSAPSGTLLQFEDEPFRLEWPRIAIVVLTPTRAFLNAMPWITWNFDTEAAAAPASLVGFYRERRVMHESRTGSTVGSRLLPEFQDRGLGPALQPQLAQ